MGWQETAAVVLLGLGGLLALLNWAAFAISMRTEAFRSPVPLFGGLFLAAGVVLLPSLRLYAWAAVALDFGTLMFALALPSFVREVWSTSGFNMVEEYIGLRGRTTATVRLFRGGAGGVRWDIARPPGEYGLVGTGRLCTWERAAGRLVLRDGNDAAVLVPADGDGRVLRPTEWFASCQGTSDLAADGLQLLRRGHEPRPGERA